MVISNGDEDGDGDRWRWLRVHFPIPTGCWNIDFMSPESPLRWRRCYGGFRGFLLDALGFLGRRLLIGARVKVGGGPGGPHPCRRLQGLPMPRGCGHPVAPSGSTSWFRVAPGKIMTLAFVPSNSENIDFLPFWNQKQKKTGNWHSGMLLIG